MTVVRCAAILTLAACLVCADDRPLRDALLRDRPLDDVPLDDGRIFDVSRLLDVRIELSESDWDLLRTQTRNLGDALAKEPPPTPFTYFKGNVTIDGYRIESVGIRKKGFVGSLDEERPSLKIKFSEYEDKDPIAGVDRLTLNNNKQDDTFASQFIAYRLFASAGLPASRCSLARVSVNGVNLGIYSNVESVKKPFLRRVFGDDSGNLFEGTLADFFPDRLNRFEAKIGTEDRSVLTRLAEVLAKDGPVNMEELGRIVDLDAFVKYWALESLISFWDGYTNNQNNYFVYQSPKNSRLYWIPWGVDCAFSLPPPIPFLPRGPASVNAHSALSNRLYHDEPFRERYRKTLLGLLADVWKEDEIFKQLDSIAELVSDHLHPRQKSFTRKSTGLRSYIGRRRTVLLNNLEDWPVDVVSKPRLPMYTVEVGTAIGSFSTKWSKHSPDDPYSVGEAILELSLKGKPVKFTKLGVRAGPGNPSPGESDPSRPRPPSITFTGKREKSGKRCILGFGVRRKDFRPTAGDSAPTQGILIEGYFGFKFLSGTVTFEEAKLEEGAVVKGRMDLKVLHMKQPR